MFSHQGPPGLVPAMVQATACDRFADRDFEYVQAMYCHPMLMTYDSADEMLADVRKMKKAAKKKST
jgi:hypothetical protein